MSASAATVEAILGAPRASDSEAESGCLKVSPWTPPDGGEPRLNMSLVADQVMTLHEHRRAREAVQQARNQLKGDPQQRATIEDGASSDHGQERHHQQRAKRRADRDAVRPAQRRRERLR
ncbi:hypothetical protein [Variovorax saccharolyticus]|uniref:hypothetical protein n=1 Tax=Variovorax saccharolyticus TaxID=3053516 RepID=UPI00257756F9|nr:hypothetical protein [Variovorax sp. J31P216]MDM0028384.1 hypothetical protein [Variovorax sp. J31P216]